jgi:gas vesicle protein
MSEENNGATTLLAFVIGAAVGAAAGILLAPRSGRDTRRRLRGWAEDAGEELMEQGRELFEEGKRLAREKMEKVKRSVHGMGRDGVDEPAS